MGDVPCVEDVTTGYGARLAVEGGGAPFDLLQQKGCRNVVVHWCRVISGALSEAF